MLFFAQVRQATGCDQIEIKVPKPISAGELWRQLGERFPGIGAMQPTTRLARNHEFASADSTFADTDEVALIPTVSGG